MPNITQTPIKAFRFGKALRISPKTNAFLNNPGFTVHYPEKTVSIIIGIGTDHTAELSMTLEAWEQMTLGAPINFTYHREFTRKAK